MAASEAAGSSFKEVGRKKKSKRLKTTPVQKIPVQRAFKYTIRVYFPTPRAKDKFNPVTNMRMLFSEMLKYDSSITVENPIDNNQLQLATDAIPTNEEEFKKYFTVTQDTRPQGTQPHIIVGCYLTSERTIRDIKFDSTQTIKFIDWLSKAKIFIESDALGIKKTATIGYLSKVHPRLTNRTHLKPTLIEELNTIVIDPALACELDPTQKPLLEAAKANGDMFIPELPPFELFKTRISYGRDQSRVKTDVIGIKCTIEKSRLLKEFFSQLGTPMDFDTRLGVFIPTGAVHMLGPEAYTNLLCDNNAFIDSVATVPIGDFQHETLDIPYSCDANTDIDQTTLTDTILEQPWCLSIERTTTPNKVLVLTTKGQLATARDWVDNTLPVIYKQHIDDKIDVTTLQHLTPRRLDKPVVTSASLTYAAMLKQRTSYITTNAQKPNQFAHPPRARHTKPPEITFDEQKAAPIATTTTNTQSQKQNSSPNNANTPSAPPQYDYQAELRRITNEIENNLKSKFKAAIAQLTQSVEAMDQKFEQALSNHVAQIKATQSSQADKTTQENHTQELIQITKQFSYLISQLSQLLGKPIFPMPQGGVGTA